MTQFEYDSLTHLIDRLSLINEITIVSKGENYNKQRYPKKYKFEIYGETFYLVCDKEISYFLEQDNIKEYLKISSKRLESRIKVSN